MSTFFFSGVATGSVLAFQPGTDLILFDTTTVSAASLVLSYAANLGSVQMKAGGKSFGLTPSVRVDALSPANVRFADGSVLDVGADGGADAIAGAAGGDQLMGLGGNDSLSGGGGNDILAGGAGNDRLDGGSGNDTARYNDATAAVTVNLSLGAAQATGGAGQDTLISIERLIGSAFNDRLTGNAGANSLNGGVGADTLVGGDGNDLYHVEHTGDLVSETNSNAGTGGIDTVHSSLAAYTLGANVENGRIIASGAADLAGNSLNNLLYAGAGNNSLSGGGGIDGVSYGYATAGVTVNLALTAAQATGGSGSDQFTSIENLVGSNYNDRLSGSAGANRLDGGKGNDTLNGAAGNDTVSGGAGNDVYYADSTGDVINESDASVDTGGRDIVCSELASYTLGTNIENGLIRWTSAANLTGNSLDNRLYSGAGNNVLNGAAGSDTADYVYAMAGVTVSLAITAAQATGGSASDTLISIEHLNGSNHNDRLTGNSGANRLNGGTGNDILDGGTGADTLDGGTGNDLYYVRDVGDLLDDTGGGIDLVGSYLASFDMTTVIGFGYFSNLENARIMSGGAADIIGNAADNLIYAGAGNNLMDGGSQGYEGGDTVSYAYASSAVSVSLLLQYLAQATGSSGSDTLSDIEHLTGSAFNDRLTGDSGDNVLDGGAGQDTLDGGLGADSYRVDNAGDVAGEQERDLSVDTVYSRATTYTLSTNIEAGVILASGTASLSGNALDNLLRAGSGDNVLNGGAGLDTVSYEFAGAAVNLSLLSGNAQATGGSGSDTLVSIENLTGSEFADTLLGNASANVLSGGAGNDTLTGGGGDDVYGVRDAGDVVVEDTGAAGGRDTALVDERVGTYTLPGGVEDVWVREVYPFGSVNLTGNSLDNLLRPGVGANASVNGGAGVDTVTFDPYDGGLSIDDAIVSLATGSANIYWTFAGGSNPEGDFDSGAASIGLANVEHLRVVGAYSVSATGNDQNNRIETSLSNNSALQGLGGADTLIGGGYFDRLDGGDGNDVLDAGTGIDTLTGGSGNDVFTLRPRSPADADDYEDLITDFVSGADRLSVSGAVGDGDLLVERAVAVNGPGGFSATAELVIVTQDLLVGGGFTAAKAAAAIGSATAAFAAGYKALFALDNGIDSALYLFESAGSNATVSASELSLLATLGASPGTTAGDYMFGG